LGQDTADRVLDRRDLTVREYAFWRLVDARSQRDRATRQEMVNAAASVLSPDEVYLATMVIALFEFYNAFVDLNGVEPLNRAGYDAQGTRLSTHGYAPPDEPPI
jgi:hypothetical protein